MGLKNIGKCPHCGERIKLSTLTSGWVGEEYHCSHCGGSWTILWPHYFIFLVPGSLGTFIVRNTDINQWTAYMIAIVISFIAMLLSAMCNIGIKKPK